MIVKDYKTSLEIRSLDALDRRLPTTHPKKLSIKEELHRRKAGQRGEQSLDFHLSFLDKNQVFILHDIRLFDQTNYFQMDTLILSPFFILIVEIKNMLGTLYFEDSTKQMIRKYNDIEEGFNNPISQVTRHQQQLEKWLVINKLPPIPTESLVAISNPTTIIKTSSSDKNFSKKVMHSSNISFRIDQLYKFHKTELYSIKDLKKLALYLKKKHTPRNPDILNRFKIKEADILRGVQCPSCHSLPMERVTSTWKCTSCGHKSKQAHEEALNDYALLIDTKITNQRLRNFLLLNSRSVSTNLLTSMNLQHSGTTKGRVYYFTL